MKYAQIVFWAVVAIILTFVVTHLSVAFTETGLVQTALTHILPLASGVGLGLLAIITARHLTPGENSFQLLLSTCLTSIALGVAVQLAVALLVMQRQGSDAVWLDAAEFAVPFVAICAKIGLGMLLATWIKPASVAKN